MAKELMAVVVAATAAMVFMSGCTDGSRPHTPQKYTGTPGQAPAEQPAEEAPFGGDGVPLTAAPEQLQAEVPMPTPNETPTAGAPPGADLKRAMDLFQARCATCHGPKGGGDGPAAVAFQVKPRSFEDKGWQAKTTDAAIKQVILKGGAEVGLNPAMPPAPDLANDERLNELVALIRSFGK